MTTSQAGGKITGILALTCSAAAGIAKGQAVHISGDYAVAASDGTKPIIGHVSVANVRRSASTGFYPVANPTGDVTVEAYGLAVVTMTAAGALTAGQKVAVSAANKVIAANGLTDLGILLTASVGADDEVDVLIQPAGTAAASSHGSVIAIPFKYNKLANGDIVTNWTPGFAGTITKVSVVVTDPVTTVAKLATLNLEINATNVTGGVVALTSANSTPLGATIAGSAVTAANVFDADDTISVEASAVTAFAEGEGVILISVLS